MSGQGKNEKPIYNWGLVGTWGRTKGKLLNEVFDTRAQARKWLAAKPPITHRDWRVVRLRITVVK